MSDLIRISVDAMGGDKGPRVAVEGARLFWKERKNVSYLFHGREAEIAPLLDAVPEIKPLSRIVHADNVISLQVKPSQALR
jgi:glycerol-3-phosphate acyltransferase PlsX